nr:immunoglobulin light chain junction region [Macaca mulatta]
CQQYKSLPWTF